MIEQLEMMKAIERLRGDAVVVPVFRANIAWSQVTNDVKRDIPIGGAMGKASSFALGFCLAQPNVKVILFDGDGSLLMNLGSLVTIANQAPRNLYHFVMDNGVYATTGGQDVPGAGLASYAEMAQSAGYPGTYEFDELEEFVTQAEEILGREGPVLVSVKTVPNIRRHDERAVTRGRGAVRRTPEAVLDLMNLYASS